MAVAGPVSTLKESFMWQQAQQALDQSMIRVLDQLANFVPGLVALVVAVAFSALIAGILFYVLRRALHGVDFDARLRRWGFRSFADWSPKHSPALLVARSVFWAVILFGFLIGVAAFDTALTSQLVFRTLEYLPKVAAAVLILLAGNLIARFLARSVLIGAVNMNLQYAGLLSAGIKWLILVLAVAMALDNLEIGGNMVHIAFGILFGGIVLALALAVGLGSKDLVSRSLEREAGKRPAVPSEEPFRHI
jgi:Conserved TM helix